MRKCLIIFSVLMFAMPISVAQRVGLVLSGGGAKGLYHVGIIKAFEECGVPIDYVSGASQGAIVGAMYVAGYSPEQMEVFFNSDSVQTWLTGKFPEEYSYFFKRYEPTPEMVSIRINPDTTSFAALKIPTNIISPYRIDLAFVNMVEGASTAAGGDFDSLMVPFRCVASDVFHRKLVTFKDGSLPFAVRTSMTIPLVFKPLEKDGVLLYDGGVLNNFPWQALKDDFDPDILIGSVCVGGNKNPVNGNIKDEFSALIMSPTDYTLPDSCDFMLRRVFPDVGTLDYDKAAYIMEMGYKDAMAMMPEIKSRITRNVPKEEVEIRRRDFRNKIRPLIFEKIEVEGLTPEQHNYVMRQLGTNLHNLMTVEYFEERYMKLLATGIFTGEFPVVTFNEDSGFYTIKLHLKTRPSLKLSLGGNISSTSLNQLYLGLNYQVVGNYVSNYDLRGYLGTFYNSVSIRGRYDFFTNFPFYVDYSYSFEAYDRNTFNSKSYYKSQQWRYQKDVHNYLASSFAVPVLGNAAARVKLHLGVKDNEYFTTFHTSVDDPDKSRFTYVSISTEVETQTSMTPLFAHSGKSQIVNLRYTMGLESYTQGTVFSRPIAAFGGRNRNWAELSYRREQYLESRAKWFTFGYHVQASVSNLPSFANYYATSMVSPAFRPTYLGQTLFMPEYTSPMFIGLGIMPVFNILGDNFYVKTYAYAFIPKQVAYNKGWIKGRDFWNQFRTHSEYIFGGSVVYQTPIGPASFTVEKYSTGPKNWNFVFNFGYTLFSR